MQKESRITNPVRSKIEQLARDLGKAASTVCGEALGYDRKHKRLVSRDIQDEKDLRRLEDYALTAEPSKRPRKAANCDDGGAK